MSNDVGESEAIGWAGRAGLVAKGIPYVLIAFLALEVAFGQRGSTADRTGALHALARKPLGETALLVLAAGFLGYAAWRFAQAFLDRNDDEWPKRAGALAKGLLYVGFAFTTLKVVVGSGSSSNQKRETANAFDLPLGREIVFGVGAGFAAAAGYNVWRGVTRRFMRDMRTRADWVETLGVVGHLARGVVWAIVAWFLLKAAWQYEAHEAVGLDGALAKLVRREYGEWLLAATAFGLAAYGLFCFAQARFREV